MVIPNEVNNMLRKISVLVLVTLLFNTVLVGSVSAETKAGKEARKIQKIKNGVVSLGTGKDARIEVKLKDKTKVRGYVSEANDENFVVMTSNKTSTTIAYSQVKQVQGNNLSTGAKIAIGLGILAAVLAIWLFFENYG